MKNRADAALDRALGIDTALVDKNWSARRQNPCQPTPAEVLEAAAKRLTESDCVADCGCGTGRAVFGLVYLAGCRAVGIEADERRLAAARENLRRCTKKSPRTAEKIRFIGGTAQEYIPDESVTAFYFFNPFPASVLRGVLKNLRGRDVRLFCYYPDDEWAEVLLGEGWARTESVDLRASLGNDPRERLDIFERKKKN